MMYRAGIIGAGGIAGLGILGMHDEDDVGETKVRASHAGGYDATEDIELVAVADVDEETLATFGDAWDVPAEHRYTSHEAMLAAEDLDAVSVCTPSYLHHDHVVDAASAADPPSVIWCEKPIASQVANARAMIDACDRREIDLVVNHSFRFTEKLQRLRTLLQDEALLGEVQSVSAQFRQELLRNATHVLDTLSYLLDQDVDTVAGHLTGTNGATTALDADEQVTDSGGGGFLVTDEDVYVNVDCTLEREISSMTFQIVGTEGKCYLNNDDGEWRYWRLEDGEHVERELPGIDGAWSWDEDYRSAFPNAARHVSDLLDGAATNHSPGTEAITSLEVIIGLYVSHNTDSIVSLPLERPLEDVTVTSW
ncbi:Gfo/Idh/MocA family protein [Halomicrobium sp. HM KBTZ05]|uniref:Gfo/Idh/MocA family protein n=1 Tax=Halomicrobium sp. HM KBTZ05 TaxID=3242663 RepID=UPI0035579331